MESKIFRNKKIKIRKLTRSDLGKAKEFQDFINSLIEEEPQITINKKFSLKEEKRWLKEELKKMKKKKAVCLVARDNKKVVGIANINLGVGRQNHIAIFGITIRKGYRGMGLGSYLMEKILKLAKEELKPRPKIIRVSDLHINKVAISLYKKFGFKKIARIPQQIQYNGRLLDEIIMIRYL